MLLVGREEEANPQIPGQIIANENPDIVGIQEAIVCWDGNNKVVDSIEKLNKEMKTPYQGFFILTMDSRTLINGIVPVSKDFIMFNKEMGFSFLLNIK